MIDHEAFIRTICEHPESDDARKVFCDFLEEQNQSEHAEFIRDTIFTATFTDCPTRIEDANKQIGYAERRGHPTPLRCGSCEYCLARRRAEKFYTKYHWLPMVGTYAVALDPSPFDGPMPLGDGITAIVRRGFIDEISCEWQIWRDHAESIRHRQPVTKVTLTSMPFANVRGSLYDLEFRGSTADELIGRINRPIITRPDPYPDFASMDPGEQRAIRLVEINRVLKTAYPGVAFTLPADSQRIGIIEVTGEYTGLIVQVQGSMDGVNWVAIPARIDRVAGMATDSSGPVRPIAEPQSRFDLGSENAVFRIPMPEAIVNVRLQIERLWSGSPRIRVREPALPGTYNTAIGLGDPYTAWHGRMLDPQFARSTSGDNRVACDHWENRNHEAKAS